MAAKQFAGEIGQCLKITFNASYRCTNFILCIKIYKNKNNKNI